MSKPEEKTLSQMYVDNVVELAEAKARRAELERDDLFCVWISNGELYIGSPSELEAYREHSPIERSLSGLVPLPKE